MELSTLWIFVISYFWDIRNSFKSDRFFGLLLCLYACFATPDNVIPIFCLWQHKIILNNVSLSPNFVRSNYGSFTVQVRGKELCIRSRNFFTWCVWEGIFSPIVLNFLSVSPLEHSFNLIFPRHPPLSSLLHFLRFLNKTKKPQFLGIKFWNESDICIIFQGVLQLKEDCIIHLRSYRVKDNLQPEQSKRQREGRISFLLLVSHNKLC